MSVYWKHGYQFVICCLCYNASIYKFFYVPHLVRQHGGVAFLLVYAVVCLTLAIPLMCFQAALAQFTSGGNRGVLEVVPLLRGFAYSKLSIALWGAFPMGMRLGFSLLYIVYSIQTPLPWSSCNGSWAGNDNGCFVLTGNAPACRATFWQLARVYKKSQLTTGVAILEDDVVTIVPFDVFEKESKTCIEGDVTATELFYRQKSGAYQENILWYALAWLGVFAVARRRIVPSYPFMLVLTAFALIAFMAFAIRITFLPGAIHSTHLLNTRWSQLINMKLWHEVIKKQLLGFGITVTIFYNVASYNKFTNDFRWQVYAVAGADFMICVVVVWICVAVEGYSDATSYFDARRQIEMPGLLFVTVPDLLSTLEYHRLWTTIYFAYLLATLICMPVMLTDAILEVILFDFPTFENIPSVTTAMVCCVLFMVEASFDRKGGWEFVNQVAGQQGLLSEMTIAETICIIWLYGLQQIDFDIDSMIGVCPNMLMRICWTFVLPFIPTMVVAFRYVIFDDMRSELGPAWIAVLSCYGVVISIILAYGFTLAKLNNFNWLQLTSPTSPWYPKEHEHLITYKLKMQSVLEEIVKEQDPACP
ncbi:sodium- and chloride-dependent glycine transporter 2-like [Ornithodoros turicata]|uniref:sodium- and chloride-dependent glycine transporter 2-like n=1 Tax=Ornithodoros turicata TaxID=34597 RepID=UPI0031393E5B